MLKDSFYLKQRADNAMLNTVYQTYNGIFHRNKKHNSEIHREPQKDMKQPKTLDKEIRDITLLCKKRLTLTSFMYKAEK